MKITISNEIIDRIQEDGTVVSRIPKNNLFLYLHPDDILEKGDYSIVADIDPERLYIVGNKEGDNVSMLRGETLGKNYTYDAQYDPMEQQTRKEQRPLKNGQAPTESAARQENVSQGRQTPQHNQVEQSQRSKERPNPSQKYSRGQFRQLKLGQKHHLDISQYWNIHLTPDQMKQLRLMQEASVDIAGLGYNNPAISSDRLEELRLGHKSGFAMNEYDWKNLSAGQLKEIRLGLEHGVEAAKYAYSVYSAEQMKQLRLGLQEGLDIDAYRNPRFTDHQMYSMRCSQIFDRIKEKLKALWEAFKDFFRINSLKQLQTTVLEKVNQGLDKTIEAFSTREAVQGFFQNQPVMEETLDDRIQETVLEIKELLVSQELIPESSLADSKLSEQMNQRIREALDALMQPENIQNVENQEKIIQETAEAVIEQTGAKVPDLSQVDIQTREMTVEELGEAAETLSAEWEGLSDKELLEKIGEEMALEAQAADPSFELAH